KALQSAFVDLEALEKKVIDDILGLDGHGFIDEQLAAFLKDGLNGLVQDGFVDAIEFLAGKFKIADIEHLFSVFSGSFTLAQIQDLLGNFFVRYAGNQLAELLVDIDSLPEALVSQLGSVIGSGALGQVIGAISMDAVAGLFGQATANAIGANLFSGLGAILGVGVGAVAGSLIFEFLDDIFDGAISGFFDGVIEWIRNKSPQAFYCSVFDEASNHFVFAWQYDKDANADLRNAVSSMADIFRDRVNAVIDFVGQDARIHPYHDNIVMVWGKKHFGSAYASYINGDEDQKLAHTTDAQLVVTTTIGTVLANMDFHAGNKILARAYEMWKAEVTWKPEFAAYGGGWDRFVSDAAYERLQSIVGLAKFANAYRQDPTGYDALMATDAPISVTILQQYLQAQSLGFNDATVVRGSHFNSSLVGSAGAGDEIYLDGPATKALGRGGDDIIHPGTAADQYIDGGTGSDTVIYDLAAGAVTVDLRITTAQQTGGSGRNTLINVENLIGTRHSDWLIGNDEANIIKGLEGADTLNGGDGIDTLQGGQGNDSLVGGAGFNMASYAGARTGVAVDLGTGRATGEGDDSLSGIQAVTGSAFSDTLIGDSGDNQLDIGTYPFDIILFANLSTGDTDSVDGGPGFDTISFANFSLAISLDMAVGTEATMGTRFAAIEAVQGSAQDDTIMGDGSHNFLGGGGGNDSLLGGAGDDTANGGSGNDVMFGWAGFDMASFAQATNGVAANLATGRATGEGNDSLDGFEALIGSAFSDTLTGDAGENELMGGKGNDLISGGADNDRLYGDDGNDELYGDVGGDKLFGGGGKDSLYGWDGDDVLTGGNDADLLFGDAGKDELFGGDGKDSLYGWDGDDVLTGGNDADLLLGDAGGDILQGDAGDDMLFGWTGHDELDGGAGSDGLYGEDGNDTLKGGDGKDSLYGWDGDDVLIGGNGADTLVGSSGADTLDGGTDADTMEGGTADDLFFVMDTGDVVFELAHGGADSIITAINLTLPDHVEALRIAEGVSGITINGGSGNDMLIGNGEGNTFNGGAGDDVILAGNVTLADIYALFAI
ncbi:MAG: hypothetical protein ING86_15425, partial [Methylobacterium sp.]|nr:hypothetical protein [Methylobacterium sp.]